MDVVVACLFVMCYASYLLHVAYACLLVACILVCFASFACYACMSHYMLYYIPSMHVLTSL